MWGKDEFDACSHTHKIFGCVGCSRCVMYWGCSVVDDGVSRLCLKFTQQKDLTSFLINLSLYTNRTSIIWHWALFNTITNKAMSVWLIILFTLFCYVLQNSGTLVPSISAIYTPSNTSNVHTKNMFHKHYTNHHSWQ